MAAGSKAGSWLFRKDRAQSGSSHVLILPVGTCASSWNQSRIPTGLCCVQKLLKDIHSLFCHLMTSCFWLCRLGISVWLVYDFIQKQNWGYFALLPKVVETLNPLQNAGTAEYLWFISSVLIFLFVQVEIIILRTKSYIWCTGCEGFKLLELLCLSVQPTQTPRDTLVQSLNLLSLVKLHFPALNRSWAGTCCHHELLHEHWVMTAAPVPQHQAFQRSPVGT